MIHRAIGMAFVVTAILVAPPVFSQGEKAETVYTYVSEFQVARANWAQYSAEEERNFVPVAQ